MICRIGEFKLGMYIYKKLPSCTGCSFSELFILKMKEKGQQNLTFPGNKQPVTKSGVTCKPTLKSSEVELFCK